MFSNIFVIFYAVNAYFLICSPLFYFLWGNFIPSPFLFQLLLLFILA